MINFNSNQKSQSYDISTLDDMPMISYHSRTSGMVGLPVYAACYLNHS